MSPWPQPQCRRAVLGLESAQSRPQARLFTIFRHIQDTAAIQIIHQCQITVTFTERLLVYSNPLHHFRLPSSQSALDGTIHDAVDLIPAQVELLGHRFLTRHLQPQSIAKRSNNAVKRLPGSAQGSFTTRGPCSEQFVRGGARMQNRLKLTRVQMPAIVVRAGDHTGHIPVRIPHRTTSPSADDSHTRVRLPGTLSKFNPRARHTTVNGFPKSVHKAAGLASSRTSPFFTFGLV
jgi:hypothetical protein